MWRSFAFLEPTKKKLIERYKWVLKGLHAGEFDEIIKKHLDSRKKSTTQESTDPK
jgi:hypothetical protein